MTRRWHRMVALPMAVLCLATGCATEGSARPATATGTPFLPVYVDETGAPARPITIGLGGDVHFTGRTAALLKDPTETFGALRPLLADPDLTVLNLESAVTSRGEPIREAGNFRAPATVFGALEEAGVDAVSIAGDHVLDYGPQGFTDTLAAAAKAGFPVVGAGADEASAFRAWVTETRGVTVAVVALNSRSLFAESFAASGAGPGVAATTDTRRAIAAVIDAKRAADVVVVYNLWGNADDECPTQKQKKMAAALAEAGADVIVGSGAHTLQGAGWLGTAYVAYGLGDLAWFADSPVSANTGVLHVTVNGGAVTEAAFEPARVSRTTGLAAPLTGAEAAAVTARVEALRTCAELAATPARKSPEATPSR